MIVKKILSERIDGVKRCVFSLVFGVLVILSSGNLCAGEESHATPDSSGDSHQSTMGTDRPLPEHTQEKFKEIYDGLEKKYGDDSQEKKDALRAQYDALSPEHQALFDQAIASRHQSRGEDSHDHAVGSDKGKFRALWGNPATKPFMIAMKDARIDAGLPWHGGRGPWRDRDRGNHAEVRGPGFGTSPNRNPALGDARDWRDNDRGNTNSHRNYGDALRDTGDSAGAADSYRRATELDPTNAAAYSGLSQALAQPEIGDWEGAYRAGKRAYEGGNRDPGLLATIRMAKNQLGPKGVAKANAAPGPTAFNKARFSDRVAGTRQPSSSAIDANYANVKNASQYVKAAENLANRDPKKAVYYADESLKALAKNPRAYLAKANAYLRMKKYSDALNAIKNAIRYAEPDMKSRLFTKQSEIFNRMGRHSDALSSAKLAIGANLQNAHAYAQASWAFAGKGDNSNSVDMMRQAASLDGKYNRHLQEMMSLPEGGDMLALFEGRPQSKKETVKTDHSIFKNKKAYLWLALAAAIVFIGFGLVGAVSDTFKDTIRRKLSASAVPDIETDEEFEGMAGAEPGQRARDALLGGVHRIEDQIGQGGMGVVYRAHDTQLDRSVAVKKMREEIRSDPRERERFLKEARTVAALRQTNIVEIYQILEQGQDVYLVFEFVAGKTISELIYTQKKLPLEQSIGIMKGISAALDFAHTKGVIHRDLKPSNVMINDEGVVKVMDFGVARQAKETVSRMSMAMTNTVVGTPPYMAPEQEQGMVRKESDVFAMGVCLYEMVTGELPYRGVGAGMLMAKMNSTYAPASKIVSGLPPEFDDVMAKALEPDPDKRWKTGGEFSAALEQLVRVS